MTSTMARCASRAFATAKVDMKLIKELRALTNAPVLDCKNALSEEDVNGDVSKAVDWLRAKGMAKALTRAGRDASEGLVGVAVDGHHGAILEVRGAC